MKIEELEPDPKRLSVRKFLVTGIDADPGPDVLQQIIWAPGVPTLMEERKIKSAIHHLASIRTYSSPTGAGDWIVECEYVAGPAPQPEIAR